MNSRRSRSTSPLGRLSRSSFTMRLRTTDCRLTARRTPAASYITTIARTAVMAKATELTPCVIATAVANAQTSAVCELGIPPLLTKNHKSRRFSRARTMNTFSNCDTTQAPAGISNALFVITSYNKHPDIYFHTLDHLGITTYLAVALYLT